MKKDTTNDMTVGSPVSLIIKFMIPMCLGNLFQQFYNIADSIVAGKFIGVNALAAIGSTGSLMFFVTGWLNGLSSGFAIIVAQMFGAKKFDRMRHYVAMSIYLMAAFSIVMTIGFSLANKPILHLMNSPEEVFGDVTAYMGIIYAGLIITGAYNALAAFLRALGDSKSPLYFLIISAVINVILDVVFIVAFGMGVEGCGYATVIAQGISAVCCLIYIVKRFPILHLERKDFEICWDSFGRLLKLGIPMGLQFSITAIGTIIVQSAVNIYGPVHMAGFSAAGKIQNIFATVFTAFGATIATYVGQNRGAGKMDRVKQGVRYTQMMVLGWSVFVMFLMFFFGKYLTYLFVDPSEQDVVNGSFSLNPPSVPSFGVEWYKTGGIMTSPTVFGMKGTRLMVGGDKVFTKIGREIAVAVKEGGGNPASNSKLAALIAKAKANSVPNDNIQRIIKRAEGGDQFPFRL